jgi:hypothetical protein
MRNLSRSHWHTSISKTFCTPSPSPLTLSSASHLPRSSFLGRFELISWPLPCYSAVMAPSSSKKIASGGAAKSGMALKRVKGENFYRDAKAAARLKMLSGGKAVRDKDGKIVKAAAFQAGEDETKPGRVQPDRRWFGMLGKFSHLLLLPNKLFFHNRKHSCHFADCIRSFPRVAQCPEK